MADWVGEWCQRSLRPAGGDGGGEAGLRRHRVAWVGGGCTSERRRLVRGRSALAVGGRGGAGGAGRHRRGRGGGMGRVRNELSAM